MDIHFVGGFEDTNGCSHEISTFFIHLLAPVADKEGNILCMTLKTCAISLMNNNGYSCPIGCGRGIDLRTGEAFLVKVDAVSACPCQTLQSVWLWGSREQLSLVHTAHSSKFVVARIEFSPFPEMDVLLKLPDARSYLNLRHCLQQQIHLQLTVKELNYCPQCQCLSFSVILNLEIDCNFRKYSPLRVS
jgi:hypothetical protein